MQHKYQHDFILVDRSASMKPLLVEAVKSVNEYVKKLASENVDTLRSNKK